MVGGIELLELRKDVGIEFNFLLLKRALFERKFGGTLEPKEKRNYYGIKFHSQRGELNWNGKKLGGNFLLFPFLIPTRKPLERFIKERNIILDSQISVGKPLRNPYYSDPFLNFSCSSLVLQNFLLYPRELLDSKVKSHLLYIFTMDDAFDSRL